MNARHGLMVKAWRQVFTEAGGRVPDRNVERMLRSTHVLQRPQDTDNRRLDLVVPGLNVERGLPLFCDATIVSPIAGTGAARAGTSNADGTLLENARHDNDEIYHEVISSGLGTLMCLSCEVYGRWGAQPVRLVPQLARERTKGLHPRIRRGSALSLQHRWWGLLGVALQQSVARMVLFAEGADLMGTWLEPAPNLADLGVFD